MKAGPFKNAKIVDTITIREQKTGKANEIVINKETKKALTRYFSDLDPADDQYLFKSRKGNNPLTVSAVNMKIKSWCRSINLPGNYGTHTLRKTFGYILRRKYGVAWEVLARRYNHHSPSITRSYLGIQDDEVNGILVRCSI